MDEPLDRERIRREQRAYGGPTGESALLDLLEQTEHNAEMRLATIGQLGDQVRKVEAERDVARRERDRARENEASMLAAHDKALREGVEARAQVARLTEEVATLSREREADLNDFAAERARLTEERDDATESVDIGES